MFFQTQKQDKKLGVLSMKTKSLFRYLLVKIVPVFPLPHIKNLAQQQKSKYSLNYLLTSISASVTFTGSIKHLYPSFKYLCTQCVVNQIASPPYFHFCSSFIILLIGRYHHLSNFHSLTDPMDLIKSVVSQLRKLQRK